MLLLKNVSNNALLILTVSTGVMVVGRAFAGPVIHRLAPHGVLLMSAIVAALGLYLLGNTSGNMIFVGALDFRCWCLLFLAYHDWFCSGISAKNRCCWFKPDGWCWYVCRFCLYDVMGGVYDKLIAKKLPAGADLKIYNSDGATAEMKAAVAEANKAAGPEIINTTLIIPIILIVAFTGLYFYMRNKKKGSLI